MNKNKTKRKQKKSEARMRVRKMMGNTKSMAQDSDETYGVMYSKYIFIKWK